MGGGRKVVAVNLTRERVKVSAKKRMRATVVRTCKFKKKIAGGGSLLPVRGVVREIGQESKKTAWKIKKPREKKKSVKKGSGT